MPTIHQDEGTAVILTPPEVLREQVLVIEKAGRTCYQSETGSITYESAGRFIRMLLKSGHQSVLEHSILTVQFLHCSRGFTHELVRHRLCAFSQESTRYVNESDLHFVLPPARHMHQEISVANNELKRPATMITEMEQFYRGLLASGWKPEDARQFLPIGMTSQIVVSANFRQWRHIFKMRCDKHAHWEIRRVMNNLLKGVKALVPTVFDDFKLGGKSNKLDWYYPEYEA